MSIQQALFSEYKNHFSSKEKRKNLDREMEKYYDKLELEQKSKEDDIRTR